MRKAALRLCAIFKKQRSIKMFINTITVTTTREAIENNGKTTEVSAVKEQASEKKFYKPMVDLIWNFLADTTKENIVNEAN